MADLSYPDELCLYLDVQQLLVHESAHTCCMPAILWCVAPFLLLRHWYLLANSCGYNHLESQCINILVVTELNYKQMVPYQRIWASFRTRKRNKRYHGIWLRSFWRLFL